MNKQFIASGVIVVATALIGGWMFLREPQNEAAGGHEAAAAADFERGPHRGRMLRSDDFAMEVTIFEEGVTPEFHMYPTENGKPVPPQQVQLTVMLNRLDGEVNTIPFTPVQDYLRGTQTVVEPHSFDVTVVANYKNKTHKWTYQSYEGRTTITEAAAAAAGLKSEVAGPGVIRSSVTVTGRVVLDPARSAQVRPRFNGIIREIRKTIGDPVQPGDVLAVIESNESLQGYQVRSPIAGRITQRWASSGELVGGRPIFEIADIREVVAEFSVFPRHLSAVKEGQAITVSALESDAKQEAKIDVLSPVADPITQTIVARVRINNAEGLWRPGMTVSGRIVTGEHEVTLMVKNSGLQAFRDFTVVFAKVRETYEVRMLELGESDGTHTEVLGGLKPGTPYASENSFLIKADIEKSGASHDH